MLKTCRICKQEKPLDQFNPRYDRPGSYRNECKKCHQELNKELRRKRRLRENLAKGLQNKERVPKTCSVCNQEKPLDQFAPYYDRPGKYRSQCKRCYQNLKNERRRRRGISFWEKLAANLYGKGGYVPIPELRKLGYPEGQKCYLCGKEIKKREDAEIDHILPRAKGGENKIENIAWTHHECNRIKHDLTIEELKEKLEAILQHHELSNSERKLENGENLPFVYAGKTIRSV